MRNMRYYNILLFILITLLPLPFSIGCQSPAPVKTGIPKEQPLYQKDDYLFIKQIVLPAEVKPNTQVQVSCTANNPRGNNLTYSWSATGGTIKGEGASVLWIAPESSGSYTIEVVAANGDIKSPSRSQSIRVID